MHPKIVEDIRRDGLEFMGCYRAPTGICFFLAGRVATTDYRDRRAIVSTLGKRSFRVRVF